MRIYFLIFMLIGIMTSCSLGKFNLTGGSVDIKEDSVAISVDVQVDDSKDAETEEP